MNEVTLGGRTFTLSMKMLAVRKYKEMTGLNLAGGSHSINDILGWGEGKEFDPDLFCKFIYCCMVNGMHPAKPDFTFDDVCNWIAVYDHNIASVAFTVYMTEMTGKTMEQIKDELEKNLTAPATTGAETK